ncbi:uncharacterized protein [Apostichopus japonicus]|uniref:uncharacterized protein isoform X2 n=1 Tax=Stichopus japonicus TaxID=307972 RepID=UPI003AB44F92
MGHKRKSKSVLKFSEEKRKALSWHFLDAENVEPTTHAASSSRKAEKSENKVIPHEEEVIFDGPGPPLHVSKAVHQMLYDQCNCSISIFHQGYSRSRGDVIGSVFSLRVTLGEYSCWNGFNGDIDHSCRRLPDSLPSEPANFMINSSVGLPYYMVYDEETATGSASTHSNGRKQSFLCLEASLEKDLDLTFPMDSVEYLCRVNKGTKMRLEVTEFSPNESFLTINVYLLKGILSDLKGPSDVPPQSKKARDDRQHLQLLLAFCYGFHCPSPVNFKKLRRLNLTEVFKHVYEAHKEESLSTKDLSVQHEKLIPNLRPYQVNAVRWMIEKEKVAISDEESGLHKLWKPLETLEGRTLYYNPLSAQISTKPFQKLPPSPGGILADEMGLGKTVEMLACILNNPRPGDQPWLPTTDVGLIGANESGNAGDPQRSKVKSCRPASQVLSETSPEGSSVTVQSTQKNGSKFVGKTVSESVMSEVIERSRVNMLVADTDNSAIASCAASPISSTENGISVSSDRSKEISNSKDTFPITEQEKWRNIPQSDCSMESIVEEMDKKQLPPESGEDSKVTMSQVAPAKNISVKQADEIQTLTTSVLRISGSPSDEKVKETLVVNAKIKAQTEVLCNGHAFQATPQQGTTTNGNVEKELPVLFSDSINTPSQDRTLTQESNHVRNNSVLVDRASSEVGTIDDSLDLLEKERGTCDKIAMETSDGLAMEVGTEVGTQLREKVNIAGTEMPIICSHPKLDMGPCDVDIDHQSIPYTSEVDRNQDVSMETVAKEALTLEVKQMDSVVAMEVENSEKSGEAGKDSDEVVRETGLDQASIYAIKANPVKRVEGYVKVLEADGVHREEDQSCSQESRKNKNEDDVLDESTDLDKSSRSGTVVEKKPSKRERKRRTRSTKEDANTETEESAKVKFVCLCGKVEDELTCGGSIQCLDCLSWQHIKCVNWSVTELNLPSPLLAKYRCPHCQVKQPPVKSSATLIISPSSISQQWVDEINHHVRSNSLKILIYRGVRVHKFLQPLYLAQHDIVITTYSVLSTELNYVDLPHCNSNKLRHAKRYMAVPSPLPVVEWWRVCLDEAQMVESPTAKSAEMALRLTAVNRWCVTGTPVQTGLNDLYGLFLFLNEDPYRTKFWWDRGLCGPFANDDREPMLAALTKKLWRTAKKDVLDQINIPSQTEQVHWLKFSPVEAHYYKRKHEGCASQFNLTLTRVKADTSMKLSDMDRKKLAKLVLPLLSLRQACCHPQAVRGEFIRLNQSTMKMEDLLQSLIGKAKLECEEAQRQLVCAINGQAAMHMIEGEVVSAVEKYREVLRNEDEQKGKLKVDSLQIFHAMHNLGKLLEEKHEGVAPTTRDGKLTQQMEEMRVKYMGKALNNLNSCGQSLFLISEKITSLEGKVNLKKGPGWWLEASMYLMQQGRDEELITKIKDEAPSGSSAMDQLINRFEDCRGLQYVVQEEVETLMRCYKEAKAGVKRLSKPVTAELVSSTVDCHLRPFKGRAKNDCLFCKVEGALQEYEMRLFAFEQRNQLDTLAEEPPSTSYDDNHKDDNVGNYTVRPRGTWAMSELQKILKTLLAFFRQVNGDPWTAEEGTLHLEMIEQMQKEFKPLRAYWGALMERVAAMDELDMAKMRLRVKLPDEPYDPESQPYIILPEEIEGQKAKLLNDRFVASSELRQKMGQLVYLQNLEKAQSNLGGINPDPCPICTRPLGTQWAVLHCGHCYCCECMSVLQTRNPSPDMRCPVCRQTTARKEVSFVSTDQRSDERSSETDIKVHNRKVKGSGWNSNSGHGACLTLSVTENYQLGHSNC